MEQTILQGVSLKERVQALKDSCVKKEKFTYPKNLSIEQMSLERHGFTQNAISVAIADKQLKEARELYKVSMKPVKQEMKDQMAKIRSGVDEVTGDVFLMDDQESNEMGYYNEKGDLVYCRPLMQDERQLRLLTTDKNGTK